MNIKDKIAKLLALAGSPEPEEAKAALLKAREMMAKYKLRPEEFQEAEKNGKVIQEFVGVSCTVFWDPWVADLAAFIAAHYCCKTFSFQERGKQTIKIGFIGLKDDFEVCKQIFLYARDCANAAGMDEITQGPYVPPNECRKNLIAYGYGFAAGVDKALKEQEVKHPEWGLVLKTPQSVLDAAARIGEPRSLGHTPKGALIDQYKYLGYYEGMGFDPARRISAAPDRASQTDSRPSSV